MVLTVGAQLIVSRDNQLHGGGRRRGNSVGASHGTEGPDRRNDDTSDGDASNGDTSDGRISHNGGRSFRDDDAGPDILDEAPSSGPAAEAAPEKRSRAGKGIRRARSTVRSRETAGRRRALVFAPAVGCSSPAW